MRTALSYFALLLAWAFVQPSVGLAQSNDDWNNATVIGALPYAQTGLDTTTATVAATDPPSICFVGAYGSTGRATVWYRYTTGASVEYLNLSTQGSNYDTVINVYTGTPGAFRQVIGGCNDDGVGTTQSLIAGLRLQPNTSYSIEVLSHGTLSPGGTLNLQVSAAPVYNVTVQTDAALTLAGCPGPVCSLRAAVRKANLEPGAIVLPAGTFQLTLTGSSEEAAATGDLDVHASMSLYGAGIGQTIIDPAATLAPGSFPNERTFDIDPNGSGANAATGRITANFADLEIRNSGGGSFFGDGGAIRAYSASGSALVNNDFVTLDHVKISNSRSALNGGAIADSGRMMIADSEFSGNTAGSTGGALTLGPSFAGGDSLVEITRTLIANNTSTGSVSGGGGIKSTGGLRLSNSTITGNSTPYHGGGIYLTGTATVDIRSSTIAGNRAASGGSASANGGGVRIDGGTLTLLNSLLSDNLRGTAASSVGDDCTNNTATLIGGYDLLEATTCAFSGSNIVGSDAHLDVLAANGGGTRTLALLDGSPALDAGDPAGCTNYLGEALTTDQRGTGYARVSHGACDIGAFERQVAATATTPGVPDLLPAGDSGSSSSDNLTNVTAPAFSGSCTNGDTVTLVSDGTATAASGTCSGGAYTLTLSPAATDGTHAIAARASLGASVSPDSAALNVTFDTGAPSLSITSAPSGSVVDSSASVAFTREAGASVTCTFDGNAVVPCSSPITASGLAPGPHAVGIAAYDGAGNSATASATWTVVVPDALDAPLLDAASDTGRSSTDAITRADPIVLLGTCTTGDSIQLYDAGVAAGAPAVCSGGYSIALSGLAEGTHTLTARTTRNGLTSNPGLDAAVVIDRHADAPTLVAGANPVAPDTTLSGTTEPSAAVQVSEGAQAVCSATADAGGAWSCTAHFASGGTHSLTAVATDVAGNDSSPSAPATLDVDLIFRNAFE